MYSISNDRPESLHAEWVMSNVCNYSCSYCSPDLYGGSSKFPDVDVAKEFWKFVHTDINPNNKMLTLSGGEPTLWPKLAEFLNGLHPSWYTAIVTNGSRTIRWWEKFIKECSNIHRITISVHLEYADINHILQVCKLVEKLCQVTVLVLFDNTKIPYAKEIAKKFQESNLDVTVFIKPIVDNWGTHESIPYTKKDLKFLKKFDMKQKNANKIPVATHLYVDGEYKRVEYAHEMIAKSENKFKDWTCEIGSKRLVVWHDGNVYGAQCATAKKFPLGNIKDKKIKKMTSVVCQNTFCNCIPDLRIPKWSKTLDVPV